jgi:hypothetical protein
VDVDEKYVAALKAIEEDTQDTVIGYMHDEHRDLDSLIAAIVVDNQQQQLLEALEGEPIVTASLLSRLAELDRIIEKLPPEVAAELWKQQGSICEAAEQGQISPALSKKLPGLVDRYQVMQLKNEGLTSTVSAWSWGALQTEDGQEE